MSEHKHTPGPWVTFYKPKYNEWHVSLPCDDSTMRVALCPDGVIGSTVEECEANAHLISAAPEMLEALRKVPLFGPTDDNLGWRCAGCGSVSGVTPDGLDRDEECAPDCYVAIVEAAVAKAEGK